MPDSENPNECYDPITNSFIIVVNKHERLKRKHSGGNKAPFLNKELLKRIYLCNRLGNKFCCNPAKKNKLTFDKQRNKYLTLRQRDLKNHLVNITVKGFTTN